ncbi:hypothetical protein K439DRAFT_57649 [Ramaria rubella]|nr:hypothetical protein K439DRAFT_57649 [Ramaria rubella]
MLSRRRYFLITLISAPAIFGKDVQVSVAGDSYGPSLITANVLDEIKISFTVGSASFTQSTFDQPCVPLAGGINSGPVTIPSGHGPQSFKFVLQTPDPLYFFSFFDNSTAQCKNGFVSSINASASQLTQFKASAENFNAVEPALQGPETSNLPKGPSPIPSPTSAEHQIPALYLSLFPLYPGKAQRYLLSRLPLRPHHILAH